MNVSKKKSRSARRKSPLKKSRSARRKLPHLKKSRSTRRKSPSRRYHHKLHLRGGVRVKCSRCKSEKN